MHEYWPSLKDVFQRLYPALDYDQNAWGYTREYRQAREEYKKTRDSHEVYQELMRVHRAFVAHAREKIPVHSLAASILLSGYDEEPVCSADLPISSLSIKTYNEFIDIVYTYFAGVHLAVCDRNERAVYDIQPEVVIRKEMKHIVFTLSYVVVPRQT